jgi:hypothetical protein
MGEQIALTSTKDWYCVSSFSMTVSGPTTSRASSDRIRLPRSAPLEAAESAFAAFPEAAEALLGDLCSMLASPSASCSAAAADSSAGGGTPANALTCKQNVVQNERRIRDTGDHTGDHKKPNEASIHSAKRSSRRHGAIKRKLASTATHALTSSRSDGSLSTN